MDESKRPIEPPEQSGGWDRRRDDAVLDIAVELARKELEESSVPVEQLKQRVTQIFSAISVALVFLIGSSLDTVKKVGLSGATTTGIVLYGIFGALTVALLWPYHRYLYVDARVFRDDYFRGTQDLALTHKWDLRRVKWKLIEQCGVMTDSNLKLVRNLRWVFVVFLLSGAASVTLWAIALATSP